jgi:hypothetical protein
MITQENGKLVMDLPLDTGISKMLTNALGVLIAYYGQPMIEAMEERDIHGRLTTKVSYLVEDGPCAGRRFEIALVLEPEGEVITH